MKLGLWIIGKELQRSLFTQVLTQYEDFNVETEASLSDRYRQPGSSLFISVLFSSNRDRELLHLLRTLRQSTSPLWGDEESFSRHLSFLNGDAGGEI